MADSVKFIFKTLIKVPLIIAVAFLIFNIFTFFYTYFKLLGISYVVMETAVENNYIPENELKTLTGYLDGIESTIIESPRIVVIDNGNESTSDDLDFSTVNKKHQYGHTITVGVECRYNFVWPLSRTKVTGLKGDDDASEESLIGTSGDIVDLSESGLGQSVRSNMRISYTVPGLKYYPDMK